MGTLAFTYTSPLSGTKIATLSNYDMAPPPSSAIYETDPGSGLERKWIGVSDGRRYAFTIELRNANYEDLMPILESWLLLKDYAGTVEMTQGAYTKTWTNLSLENAAMVERDTLWKGVDLTFVEVTGT